MSDHWQETRDTDGKPAIIIVALLIGLAVVTDLLGISHFGEFIAESLVQLDHSIGVLLS